MELLNKDITDKIIKAFYNVYNELGYGFLEKVYQNALFLELIAMGLACEKQRQIKVYYNEQVVVNILLTLPLMIVLLLN